MTDRFQSAAKASAITLLLVVATQLFYILVVSGYDGTVPLRAVTWLTEVAAFTFLTVAAFVLATRSTAHPFAWGAIAVGSILNMLQSSMGVSMFGPASEAADPQVMATVLAGAFFFYFLAKALYALAGIGFGLRLLKDGAGAAKMVGGLAIATGLGALVLNILAMSAGRDWTQLAGGAGTAATAFLALSILMVPAPHAASEEH